MELVTGVSGTNLACIFKHLPVNNRQHLWLAAEGWIYLVLALLDMVSHLLPAGRKGAETFKALDTVLGALSCSVPVLLLC
jgi:hypothetical protein